MHAVPINRGPFDIEPRDNAHDASCIHCGGRTDHLDPVCLRCRGRDPRRQQPAPPAGPIPATSELDQLLALKGRLEDVIANQPRRRTQLARQLSETTDKIDAIQGQRSLL